MRRIRTMIGSRLVKRVPAESAVMYAVACLIGLLAFLMAFTEYNNYLIVRQLEAASDLAAVEAVRFYVDETELRNEHLVIKEEDIPKIRDKYLEKVRDCVPGASSDIIRIEIPSIVGDTIEIPDNYEIEVFPNSTSDAFVDYGEQYGGTQRWFLLDGTTPGNSAAALVQDFSNLNTASDEERSSYIFTVKVTVIYESLPIFGRTSNLLNFVDIFTNQPVSLKTKWKDKGVNCVTIESQGKVTLR